MCNLLVSCIKYILQLVQQAAIEGLKTGDWRLGTIYEFRS